MAAPLLTLPNTKEREGHCPGKSNQSSINLTDLGCVHFLELGVSVFIQLSQSGFSPQELWVLLLPSDCVGYSMRDEGAVNSPRSER